MEGVLLGIRDNKIRALKIRLGYQPDETNLKPAINGDGNKASYLCE